MGTRDPYLRCSRCGETKKKEGNFPAKSNNISGYRGICWDCEPEPVVPEPEPPRFKPETVAKMCTGKRKYKTKNAAIKATMKYLKIATKQRVYRCPICSQYHLTTKEKK